MTTTTHRRQTDMRGQGDRLRVPIVRWGAVFAGAVVAIGLLFLLNSFFEALAFSSDVTWFRDTISWWRAIDSIVVLAVAGLLAGWLARTPGWGAGLLNGITAWGLLIAGATIVGVSSDVPITSLAQAGAQIGDPQRGSLWPTFLAYALGFVAAAVGGMIGGSIPRPAFMFESFDDTGSGIDLRERRADGEDLGFEGRATRAGDLGVEGRATPPAEPVTRARYDVGR